MKQVVEIYSDGACRGNPGIGGWGVLIRYGDAEKKLYGGEFTTTNNRMELLAVIVGLEQLKNNDSQVLVYSDSKYVVDSVEKKWVFQWEKKHFKGKKNIDLWKRFLTIYNKHKVTLNWVKGHAGHPENERCDYLAVEASEQPQLLVDEGYEKTNDVNIVTSKP